MSLSSGSQKFFSSAGVRIRGALLSIGSRPYSFADLCQELDTASIPGGGVAPSATEQTCSACPTIVPSELAERSESPITAPGSRWWLIAMARRQVSDCGERAVVATPKKHCRSGIKVHRAEYPRNHRN